MIFCLVCFLGCCSGGECSLFRYCRATFYNDVRTISMNSFQWWDDVHNGATISLQRAFLCSLSSQILLWRCMQPSSMLSSNFLQLCQNCLNELFLVVGRCSQWSNNESPVNFSMFSPEYDINSSFFTVNYKYLLFKLSQVNDMDLRCFLFFFCQEKFNLTRSVVQTTYLVFSISHHFFLFENIFNQDK